MAPFLQTVSFNTYDKTKKQETVQSAAFNFAAGRYLDKPGPPSHGPQDDLQYAGKALLSDKRSDKCWLRHPTWSQHSRCMYVFYIYIHMSFVCGRRAFFEEPRGRDGSIRYNSQMFCQMQRLSYAGGLTSLDEAARPRKFVGRALVALHSVILNV